MARMDSVPARGDECLSPDVSVVLPCLNEEDGVGICIDKIHEVFEGEKIRGEVVVVDNGSTDRSVEVAERHGARIVHEPRRGYGRAYLKGFSEARGRVLVMGDADDTYDFSKIPLFLQELERDEKDFVTGSRYLIDKKQQGMPLLHKFIGNPLLTLLLNRFFGCRYSDVYCGFRAFTRAAYRKIQPVSPGMEFNLEIAINAKLANLKIGEIPIELAPRKGESKLRTFRDGWRSLRMMLLYCPNKVFLVPGGVLSVMGLLLHALVLGSLLYIDGRPAGIVTSLFATLFSVVGFQVLSLGLHAKTYSWSRRYDKENRFIKRFYEWFRLETGLILGASLGGIGALTLAANITLWLQGGMQPLSYPEWVSFGATLSILGCLVVFTSLFISSMQMGRDFESIG